MNKYTTFAFRALITIGVFLGIVAVNNRLNFNHENSGSLITDIKNSAINGYVEATISPNLNHLKEILVFCLLISLAIIVRSTAKERNFKKVSIAVGLSALFTFIFSTIISLVFWVTTRGENIAKHFTENFDAKFLVIQIEIKYILFFGLLILAVFWSTAPLWEKSDTKES